MENNKSKEFFLNKKFEQLGQWERVIKKIISKAEEAEGKKQTKMYQHLENIQTQKSRIENILDQLQTAENERWDSSKKNLEKNWVILRKAFLKASESINDFVKK